MTARSARWRVAVGTVAGGVVAGGVCVVAKL
jgi:hypothetical protein